MAGVTADLQLSLIAKLIGSSDFDDPVAPVNLSKRVVISEGTDGLDKADILWADERTIAASSSENLDLAGVLSGLLGGTITAAEIVAIVVIADTGNTNDVVLFGAASNPFNMGLTGTTPKIAVGPGDLFVLTNRKGVGVTAGTGDILLVANSSSGSAVTYKIAIIGRTVAA